MRTVLVLGFSCKRAMVLLAGLLVVAGGLAVSGGGVMPWGMAATNIGSGTAVTVGTLDNLLSTILDYTSGAAGKVIATIMLLAGIMMAMAGKMGLGVSVAGSGMATAFVPGIVANTYTGAALPGTVAAAAQPVALHFFAEAFLVALYPLAVGLSFLSDPVVAVPLAALLASDRGVRRWAGEGVRAFGGALRKGLQAAAC